MKITVNGAIMKWIAGNGDEVYIRFDETLDGSAEETWYMYDSGVVVWSISKWWQEEVEDIIMIKENYGKEGEHINDIEVLTEKQFEQRVNEWIDKLTREANFPIKRYGKDKKT